ncbi:MAG: uroporphyrinogen decarboxylase family protein [Armatimonadota bacterium]|jgi:uroporphyrinogen decarboxylase
MTGRERILTALDGGRPDRVARALGFGHVDLRKLAPPEEYRDDLVDVQFVSFGEPEADAKLRQIVREFPADTRLGTPGQAANYRAWRYHPETVRRRNPLARARSLRELAEFPFPEPAPVDHSELSAQVAEIHRRGLAAGGSLPHLGGELFEPAWRLRGLENFLLDMVERPAWAHLLLDRLQALACAKARALARAGVDVLALGDDVGMPGAMIFGPELWRAFFRPRMSAIIAAARDKAPNLRVLYHSDGWYAPIVGDLMEIGVNAINPIQPEHMDAATLRRRHGTGLALWGTVGHQNTLAHATPDEIRDEVRRRLADLGTEGLVIAPAYDIWPDVPWANLRAFIEATEEHGRASR